MNQSPLARSVSLAIISLLIGPALTHASDAPATPPDKVTQPDTVTQPDPVIQPDTQAAPPVTQTDPETQAVEDDTPQAEDESTSFGLDRSTWPVIRVSPADGSVTHHPAFMGDPPMGEDVVNPLHAPDPVWQIQEALAGAVAGNLNGENLSALGAQPIIGLIQFLALPFHAILENPLSEATSP